MQKQGDVDRQPRQGREFFPKSGQTRWGQFRGKIFPRLGFEKHHDHRQPQALSLLREILDDGAMAQVNAIEVADSGHAPAFRQGRLLGASEQAEATRW